MSGSTTSPQQSSIIENHDAGSSQNPSNPLVPKLRKGAKAKYIIEEHPIMDGMGKVVRTAHTGLTYHCFFYVKAEKKWLRKSLHTKKLPEALQAGLELMINTLATINRGERVFNKSYQEVVDEFLKMKQEEADVGDITKGRVTTIRCILNWVIKFAGGKDVRINALDGQEWRKYYVWRKQQKPDVKDMTLANERSAITTFFQFASDYRYITHKNIPIWNTSLKKSKSIERRDAFNDEEYDTVCRFLNHLDKHGKNEKEKDERRFIRDFFYISTNTGMRFGEMRRIKWHQVRILKECDSHGYPKCVIKLNKEDTKNRKPREVQGMRGDIFERIKEYSKHKKSTDYVFADNETGEQLPKAVYYKLWKELMLRANLQDREKLTWYSTRHTYATFRLLKAEGLDVFTLAKNMGTSVKFIEDHYGHVETAQKRKELTSKKKST